VAPAQLNPDALLVARDQLDAAPSEHDSRASTGDVSEVAASLADLGLLKPVGVRQDSDRYRLVYGHRRVAAARLLGRSTIAAVLVEATSDEEPIPSKDAPRRAKVASPGDAADDRQSNRRVRPHLSLNLIRLEESIRRCD
jgi:hypothetical protein